MGDARLCSCPCSGSDLERETRTEEKQSFSSNPLRQRLGRFLPWWPLHANEQTHCRGASVRQCPLPGVPCPAPLTPAGPSPAGSDGRDPSPNCEVSSSRRTEGASRRPLFVRQDTGLGRACRAPPPGPGAYGPTAIPVPGESSLLGATPPVLSGEPDPSAWVRPACAAAAPGPQSAVSRGCL